jgi:hypothetical protein
VNLGWQQRLAGRYYGDAYLGQHWFRYDSMHQLNYENAEASLGMLAILPELKNSIFTCTTTISASHGNLAALSMKPITSVWDCKKRF